MNDDSSQGETGLFKTDKTYDLGKGITVTVARAVHQEREPLQVLPVDQNWKFKSPIAFKQPSVASRSNTRRSPLQKVVRKSESRSKASTKENKPVQEHATVLLNRSLTPKRQTVIDFSDPKRGMPQRLGGIKLTLKKKINTGIKVDDRQFRTSRDKAARPLDRHQGRLKQQSECNIHNALLHNSAISDLMKSNFDVSQSQAVLEATATFGNAFQDDDLILQWQHLAMRCETIDVSLALTAAHVAELDQKRRVLDAEEERMATKALFLLDKLAEIPDTECKALCDIELGTNDFWSKVSRAGQAVGDTILRIDEIGHAVKERCGWFEEIRYLAETVADESARENKRAEQALENLEDIESLLPDEQRNDVASYLGQDLAVIDLEKASIDVYSARIGRIKLEALEKISLSMKKNKNELANVASEISGLSREIDDVDTADVILNLANLKCIEMTDLMQIIFLFRRFLEAIAEEKPAGAYSIDIIEEFRYIVDTQIPALGTLCHTVTTTLYDSSNLASVSILTQLLQRLLDYCMFGLNGIILTHLHSSIPIPSVHEPTDMQKALLRHIFKVTDDTGDDNIVDMYHGSSLLIKASKLKQMYYNSAIADLSQTVDFATSVIATRDQKVMLEELDKNGQSRCFLLLRIKDIKREQDVLVETDEQLKLELSKTEHELKKVRALKDEKNNSKEIKKTKKSRENSRSISNATRHKSSSSIIKKSDSSLYIGSKELAIQSMEECLEDNLYERLDEKGKLSLDSLISKMKMNNGKSAFTKRLLKLLDNEYNLEQHCSDWVCRGLHGLKTKKGPKYTFSTAGSKKVDSLEIWTQMCSNRVVDLEKKGFCHRLLRYDSTAGGFVMLKPYKRTQCDDYWDTNHLESLESYTISIDEVN